MALNIQQIQVSIKKSLYRYDTGFLKMLNPLYHSTSSCSAVRPVILVMVSTGMFSALMPRSSF